jgi:hypothetical protein
MRDRAWARGGDLDEIVEAEMAYKRIVHAWKLP